MLDDYKDNKFYNYFKNLKNCYHAYLFEVDNLELNLPFILAFSKMLICKNHYTNKEKCESCNICHLIDKNYYEDLKIIEPDGISIKKEQILNLQKELSLKSSNNTNQVYIIEYADKLNLSAANSLLKFIEEPTEGIIGILITTDIKQILPTIISRCSVFSLKSSKNLQYNNLEIQDMSKFLSLIITKKENSLPYLKKEYLNKYLTKKDILKTFNIMENIFDCLINQKFSISNDNLYFYDIIDESLKELLLNDLLFYLEKIIEFKNKLINVSNLNINLFMDRFIIEISRVML